jgi:hypothetical protein
MIEELVGGERMSAEAQVRAARDTYVLPMYPGATGRNVLASKNEARKQAL